MRKLLLIVFLIVGCGDIGDEPKELCVIRYWPSSAHHFKCWNDMSGEDCIALRDSLYVGGGTKQWENMGDTHFNCTYFCDYAYEWTLPMITPNSTDQGPFECLIDPDYSEGEYVKPQKLMLIK